MNPPSIARSKTKKAHPSTRAAAGVDDGAHLMRYNLTDALLDLRDEDNDNDDDDDDDDDDSRSYRIILPSQTELEKIAKRNRGVLIADVAITSTIFYKAGKWCPIGINDESIGGSTTT